MILRFIELRDFLSHEHEKISFPERGVIQLSGNSGSGKSSLICDAVGFVLFGAGATRAPRIDDLRRLDAPGKAFGVKVALVAEDGTTYEVERGTDKDGKSFARLMSDSGHHADGATAVKQQLHDVIGTLDAKTYHRAFVARQDDISALTEMDGSKRRDFIHRMLGIDALDTVGSALRAGEREQGALLRHLEERLGTASETELVRAAADASAGAQQAIAAQSAAAETARLAASAVEDLDSRLVPVRRGATIRAAVESELALCVARRADMERELAEHTDSLANRQQAQTLVAQVDSLTERHRHATDRKAAVVAARAAAARRREVTDLLERIGAERRSLVDIITCMPVVVGAGTVERLREELTDLTATYRTADSAVKELEANRAQLERDGVCSLCLREAHDDDHAALVAQINQRIASLTAERADATERGTALRGDLERAEAAVEAARQAEDAQRRGIELAAREDELQRELSNLPELAEGDEAGVIDAELAELGTALARSEAARIWLAETAAKLTDRVAVLNTALADNAAAHSDLTAKLAAAPDCANLEHDEQELRVRREQATAAHVAEATTASAVADAQRLRDDATRHLNEYRRHASDLEAARRTVRDHRDLAKLTVGYRKQVVNELRPQLQETTSEVMSALSSGKHPAIRISEDYEIELQTPEHDGWLPVRMLSGGEKTRANFALRLALTRLVSQRTGCPVRYLVMDEIFGSQDPAHRAKMLDVMRQVQVFYPQVFLISHVGDLRGSGVCDWVVDIKDGAGPHRAHISAA